MGLRETLHDQNGAALLVTMLVLVAITILGIATINISTVEMQVVGSDRVYNMNFYQAEAISNECAALLKREANTRSYNIKEKYFAYMKGTSDRKLSAVSMTDPKNWDLANQSNCDKFSLGNGYYSAAYLGTGTGFSLNLTGNRYHEWAIFAMSNQEGGSAIHEIGFRLVYNEN